MVNNTLVRTNGRIIRRGTTPQEIARFDARVKQLDTIERNRVLNKEAARLSKEIRENNFGGSLQNFRTQIAEIRRVSPEVARRLSVNEQTITNELNNRIKSIETQISQSKSKELRFANKDNKSGERGEQAKQRGLKEGLNRLKKGELLTTKGIESFATKLKNIEKKKVRDKERRKKTQLKTTPVKPDTKFTITSKFFKPSTQLLEIESNRVLKLSGQKRKEKLLQLQKDFGKSTATAIFELASLKRDNKIFTIKDLEKISKSLEKRKASLTTGDTNTFKLSVNTLLRNQKKTTFKGDFKALPETAPLSKFNLELKRLKSFNEKNKKEITKQTQLPVFKQGSSSNLKNKVLTGQTLTPQEQKRFIQLKKLESKQLEAAQKRLLIAVIK